MDSYSIIKNNLYLKSCIEFIENNKQYTSFKNEFIKQVGISNYEILNKLLIAIIREDILEFVDGYGSNSATNVLSSGSINRFQFKTNKLDHPIGEITIPIDKVYSFKRFTISDYPSWKYINDKDSTVIKDCFQLIDFIEMFTNTELPYLSLYRSEIDNSIGNSSLSYTFSIPYYNEIIKMNKSTHTSTVSFISNKQLTDNSFDSCLFYEQLYIKGHLTHPCAKLKKGFIPDHVVKYSSEFNSIVQLEFIAIKKEYSFESSSSTTTSNDKEEEEQTIFKYYPNCKQLIVNYMGDQYEEFNYHFIHPWQVENVLPSLFKNEISQGIIKSIPSEIVSVKSCPLISLRSACLINENNSLDSKSMPHIKTPINIQITCAVRTVSSQSANNGPLMSEIFKEIVKRECDSFGFGKDIVFLSEFYGAWFNSNDPKDKSIKHKSLTNIWRDNPNSVLSETESLSTQIIVSCSLYSVSPISNKLIVIELIDHYIDKQQIDESNREVQVVKWFDLYIDKLIRATLVLMSKYGIGLEAHLQNSLWVFSNESFEPVKLIVKDWGGIRICLPRLEQAGFKFNFKLDSVTVSNEPIELHQKVLHAVFHNNIGELILSISNEYSVPESLLWNRVYQKCNHLFSKLLKQQQQTKINITSSIDHDKSVLFDKKIDIKCLTKMRLKDDNKLNLSSKVLNPLYSNSNL